MEYFPLGDLQQHMSKTGLMAEGDVCVIIYQVLEGLNYMHREGFAHRDIKPGVGAYIPSLGSRCNVRLTSRYL